MLSGIFFVCSMVHNKFYIELHFVIMNCYD